MRDKFWFMISIVIPLYNKEKAIVRTLDSVLAQTYKDYELIIVNDGSTDHSKQVVEDYIKSQIAGTVTNYKSQIRLINKPNGGVCSARNRGIKEAKGEYIAFLDADDLWDKDYLMEQVRMIADFPKAAMWGINFAEVTNGNQLVRRLATGLPDNYRGYVKDYFGLKGRISDLFHSSAVVIRKKVFDEVGVFDERIKIAEDVDMWWRIVAGIVIIALVCFLIFRPKKVITVGNHKKEYKTYDFTGMKAYPMIKVEGGTFVMGSSESDEDDCPPHNVTVSDFYIGQFEVSQKLWESIMGNNPSVHKRDSLPVENVSYKDVQLFIKKLNSKTGKQFSLPTEAQWEYAARGGKNSLGTKFSGMKYPNNIWFDKDRPFKIMFPPSVNELGIYQMSGNVAEWCLDYYSSDFYTLYKIYNNPLNNQKEKYYVVRGGSYYDDDPEYVTVYYRYGENVAKPYIGFRMVLNKN